MAMDFPNSPSTGQVYSQSGMTWVYDGAKWIRTGATSMVTASTVPTSIAAFNGILSSADTTVQAALDTADDHMFSVLMGAF